MKLKSEKIKYLDGDVTLQGYCAWDENIKDKRPAVLVAPDAAGCTERVRKKANQLAELGYLAFAIDMYGNGKCATTRAERAALYQPFMDNRAMLAQRINAAFVALKKIPLVDTARMAAIGFCFGGLCALDLARNGADIRGVVSFHGLLVAPEPAPTAAIKSKVLALHGFDDPMVPPDQVLSFAKEMTDKKVDWQVQVYGNIMHAFTNPEANDRAFGTVYDRTADQRSWVAMKDFFNEVFA